MGKKITSYDQLEDGMKVKGSFGLWGESSTYSFLEGMVFFDQEKDEYYLLQNIRAGDEPANDIWRYKGFKYSWLIYRDLENVDLGIIENEEKTLFDQLEVGDIIDAGNGSKKKVLEKLSNTVMLSASDNYDQISDWYTSYELEFFNYSKAEKPETVEINGKHYKLKDIEQLEEVEVGE